MGERRQLMGDMMTKFERICQTYMPRLINDLGITVLDAAAVFGNGGHESGGFETLQESRPVVKGSRGGYGWFQWTGPRRRAFEAFCWVNGLKPWYDEANYRFLVAELMGTEKQALKALAAARTLDSKTVAFEAAYERAGVKHYPSRKAWALKALHAYEARQPSPRPDANSVKPTITERLPEPAEAPMNPITPPSETVENPGAADRPSRVPGKLKLLAFVGLVIAGLILIPLIFGD